MKAYEKNGSIYFEGITEKIIKIPSQLYPLTGAISIFSSENTKPIEDERIISAFDKSNYTMGYCYQNSKELMANLKAEGIENAVPYAGWLIVDQQTPIHHSFVVINDESVLDMAAQIKTNERDIYLGMPPEEMLEKFAENMIRKQSLPNSQKGCCGQVDPMYLYIAAPCDPDKARALYQKLMKAFPKHPAERNVGQNGYNKTQQYIVDKLKIK